MIQARHALLLLAIIYWDAWRLLIIRIGDGAAAVPVAILLLGIAIAWNKLSQNKQLSILPIGAALIFYILAALWGTAMMKIGIALVTILLVLNYGLGRKKPPYAAMGVGLLALPILPSLDFYLAWPMRQISASLTAGLLRLNGFSVHVEGVAIAWQDQLLLFDGPCSGINMLWAALLLTSILSLIGQVGPIRYGAALIITALMAIFANALRASSLFYLETGFIPAMQGPVFHELVGISSFVILGAGLVFAFHKHNQRVQKCV